eukprot:gb/GFBE01046191.1/.p1 GENE.gb/GFBE01046191.1/~~gb/GFBE01046191.1/.p1  ORF type:complete len:232 (+),score=55.86 gb/GFBE01046191.1/:1-696(+)
MDTKISGASQDSEVVTLSVPEDVVLTAAEEDEVVDVLPSKDQDVAGSETAANDDLRQLCDDLRQELLQERSERLRLQSRLESLEQRPTQQEPDRTSNSTQSDTADVERRMAAATGELQELQSTVSAQVEQLRKLEGVDRRVAKLESAAQQVEALSQIKRLSTAVGDLEGRVSSLALGQSALAMAREAAVSSSVAQRAPAPAAALATPHTPREQPQTLSAEDMLAKLKSRRT